MKKTIIAGGREFNDKGFLEDKILELFPDTDILEVVCGEARGADALGKAFALSIGQPVTSFPAKWDELGTRAGPLRNIEMAEYADCLIAFWDGKSRGTKHMIDRALSNGLEVHVYRYGEE